MRGRAAREEGLDEAVEELRTTLRAAAVVNGASKYRTDQFVKYAMGLTFDGPISLSTASRLYGRYMADLGRKV